MSKYGVNLSGSRVRSYIEKENESGRLPFRAAFGAAEMQEIFDRYADPDSRVRIFPPTTTTQAMVSQQMSDDPSLVKAVARVNAERQAIGLKPASAGTSSFSDARQRVDGEMLYEMVKSSGNAIDRVVPNEWLWKGKFHVKMNDGSSLKMADTPANQEKYPQPRSQAEGLGFPITRCAATISLATGTFLDFANCPWRGKETGEHALVRQMEEAFEAGDVRLGDSYFPSFWRLVADMRAGIEGVFRLDSQRDVDFRKGERLAKSDHLMTWKKPQRPTWMTQDEYDAYPDTIVVREVKVVIEHPGYRSEPIVVVTTFLDPKAITKADLADLYHRRWCCELDLRSVKAVMKMAMLRGLTPDMVEKEIMATLLAYNLIRQTICDAAIRNRVTPRDISFKAAMQTINEYRIVWYAALSCF